MQADATHEEHAGHVTRAPAPTTLDPATGQEANTITPAGICQKMTRQLEGGRVGGVRGEPQRPEGERGATRLRGWLLERRAAGLAAH